MRILLIEDDALIGDGLKVGLEKLGFSVDWFTDGAEGEEALFQAPYAAVILDWACRKRTVWRFCRTGGIKTEKNRC